MSSKRTQTPEQATPAANSTQMPPIVLDIRINSIRTSGNIRATASVNMNGCFAIRGVKVMDGAKGIFVSMPSYKEQSGEYKEYCFPVTKEFRTQLNGAVIKAYQQAIAQSLETAMQDIPQPHNSEEAYMQQSM